MPDRPVAAKIEQLKTIKSAYLLEARKLKDRRLDTAAMALYLKAGEMELELAKLIRTSGLGGDAKINLLSAGSCLLLARQYRRAYEILVALHDDFPKDVRPMLAECEARDDVPLPIESLELQALIKLLLRTGKIQANEWAEAISEQS